MERLDHIDEAIENIAVLLKGKSLADVQSDRFLQAAFERFLEIISEASRHIPEDMTINFPQIPWQRIRGLGNLIRHAYNNVDPEVLWKIYAGGELADLQSVINEMSRALGEDRT